MRTQSRHNSGHHRARIFCQRLPDKLEHGAEAFTGMYVAQFVCDPCYELDGPELLTGEDDENWNGIMPNCWPVLILAWWPILSCETSRSQGVVRFLLGVQLTENTENIPAETHIFPRKLGKTENFVHKMVHLGKEWATPWPIRNSIRMFITTGN